MNPTDKGASPIINRSSVIVAEGSARIVITLQHDSDHVKRNPSGSIRSGSANDEVANVTFRIRPTFPSLDSARATGTVFARFSVERKSVLDLIDTDDGLPSGA